MVTRRRSVYARLMARVPWWLAAILASACVVVGVLLAVRPFASLGALVVLLSIGMILTGVLEVVDRSGPQPLRWRGVSGVLWVAGGLAVVVWAGLTIGVVAVGTGILLILTGLIRAIGGLRGTADDRLPSVLFGLASLVLGVAALVLPDATLFLIAILFGVRMVLFGIAQALAAWHRRSGRPTGEAKTARFGGRTRVVEAVLALALSTVLLVGALWTSVSPRPDAFYAAPANVPDRPGALLRSEPFTTDIPPNATAWRILYTTTRDEGVPAVASGIVVVPNTGSGHPVVAWAHGTTGIAESCAPSLLDRPFHAGAMPELQTPLAHGWAVVATDYVGLGTKGPHPYLIGQGEGRSVLDAIRAAGQLLEAHLGDQTVIWGHSQGGHAALWAGGLAPAYAPELNLHGVAAMAPAANLPALLSVLGDSNAGGLFGSYLIEAYATHYPDVEFRDYVRPGGWIPVTETARRCLTDRAMVVSVVTTLFSDQPVWSNNPNRGALAGRAGENVPRLTIDLPLLLAQGEADTIVQPATQRAYVSERCRAGQQIDFRAYAGRDHMSVIADDSPLLPDLMAWTIDRFAGRAAENTCS